MAAMALAVSFGVGGLAVQWGSAVGQYGWNWGAITAGVARARSGGTLAVAVGAVIMALAVAAAW